MGVVEKHTKTWTCDRCKRTVENDRSSKPSSAADPWAWLKLDQDSGFDYQGCPWAPRMREPILVCGACVEEVVSVLNGAPAAVWLTTCACQGSDPIRHAHYADSPHRCARCGKCESHRRPA
jgi:hypothetical protein